MAFMKTRKFIFIECHRIKKSYCDNAHMKISSTNKRQYRDIHKRVFKVWDSIEVSLITFIGEISDGNGEILIFVLQFGSLILLRDG